MVVVTVAGGNVTGSTCICLNLLIVLWAWENMLLLIYLTKALLGSLNAAAVDIIGDYICGSFC
jgi:hypothetical protein